jgi:H+/gluconate symporter-like permease
LVHVLPGLDTRYLAEARFGATSIEALRGIWAVIAALTAAICLLVALWWGRLPQLKQLLDEGASASALPLLNTASRSAMVRSSPRWQASR